MSDAESLAGILAVQQHVLFNDFAASQDKVMPADGGEEAHYKALLLVR